MRLVRLTCVLCRVRHVPAIDPHKADHQPNGTDRRKLLDQRSVADLFAFSADEGRRRPSAIKCPVNYDRGNFLSIFLQRIVAHKSSFVISATSGHLFPQGRRAALIVTGPWMLMDGDAAGCGARYR